MFALAGGKAPDPATKRFLLWELPLAEGWQYHHAAIIATGNQTTSRGNSDLEEFEEVTADVLREANDELVSTR